MFLVNEAKWTTKEKRDPNRRSKTSPGGEREKRKTTSNRLMKMTITNCRTATGLVLSVSKNAVEQGMGNRGERQKKRKE